MKNRNSITDRVEDSIIHSKPFEGPGPVIAGVSGGADSVAMLHALFRSGIETVAVHCNFHLRGEESERDRRFVETLCRRLDVPLRIVDFDVEAYRREHKGTSVEMACRELRYAEFRRLMKEYEARRIAIAHNSDDNAETLLLNLFRGTGVAGLRAMLPDNGEIWRPLLGISRVGIEEYLGAINPGGNGKDAYITDSTNLESDYRRNFIRNEVLPLIETRWPGVKSALCHTARIMAEEERMLRRLENPDRSETGNQQDAGELLITKETDSELLEWKARRFAMRHGAGTEQAIQIAKSVAADPKTPGRKWPTKEGEIALTPCGLEYIRGEAMPEGADISGDFEITEHENTPALMAAIKTDRSNTMLWIPKEAGEIRLRQRKTGDRIRPLGMKGSRLVSDIVSDARLSGAEKRRIAVAERVADGEILWVESLKRSRESLIRPENKIILKIVRKKEKL